MSALEEAAGQDLGSNWRQRASVTGLAAVAGTELGALVAPALASSGVTASPSGPTHPPVQGPREAAQPLVTSARRTRPLWRRLAGTVASHKPATATIATVVVAGSVGAGVATVVRPQSSSPPPVSGTTTTTGTSAPTPTASGTGPVIDRWVLHSFGGAHPQWVQIAAMDCPSARKCVAVGQVSDLSYPFDKGYENIAFVGSPSEPGEEGGPDKSFRARTR